MRRTILFTAAVAALVAGCTPSTAPAGPASTAPAPSAETSEAVPATEPAEASPTASAEEGDAPTFALEDIVDTRGVLFLTEVPEGMTQGDGYPDQSGWRVLAEGTCTLSVREVPVAWTGEDANPTHMQHPSEDWLLSFTAEEMGFDFEPGDVADLPLENGRTESGETLFAEVRGEIADGEFAQVASRATQVAVQGAEPQSLYVDLHYACPSEEDYTETWPSVVEALEVGVWTSDLWWGGN